MADEGTKQTRYIEGVGRRKRAVARVRITPTEKGFFVNNVPAETYFVLRYRERVLAPLKAAHLFGKMGVTAVVKGGGSTAQADAVRMGLARALVQNDGILRTALKKEGYLTRDSREKERRKYGLKKARRAPQFSKR
jgi:small subunit ribosomal protein S9